MIFFAVRQVIVYLLVFLMSTFIGRTAGAVDFAAFTLFNFVFGLTYIVADLGFGKAALRGVEVSPAGDLALARAVNVVIALAFGSVLAVSVYATHRDPITSMLIALFFGSAAASFGPFVRAERAGDFGAIGRAEIAQVSMYFGTFFAVYAVSRSVRGSILSAVLVRIVSIPLSYAAQGRSAAVGRPDMTALPRVLRSTLNGFQHQVSLVLFALKDLLLAYLVLAGQTAELRGTGLMAQTYMMIPLMFASPVSRVLLPRLSGTSTATSAATVRRLMTVMALYAVGATLVVYAGFGTFNTWLLAGKFAASGALLPYFAAANVMSIPALAVASFLASTQGYRAYLGYAVLCSVITWASGALLAQAGHWQTAYPVAVLAGHTVNLGLIIWFLSRRGRP